MRPGGRRKLGGFPVVVKAQIHAGGRGKGGGVNWPIAEEVETWPGRHPRHDPGDPSDRPRGEVKKVLVEQGLNIAKELYLSILPDRATAKMSSWPAKPGAWTSSGGRGNPGKDHQGVCGSAAGIQPYHCREAASGSTAGCHETFHRCC
jgi:succinyl-CoA synthetase beta subunit